MVVFRIIPVVATIILFFSGGCAAPLNTREAFLRASSDLTPEQRCVLLDALKILSLLEDYRLALERKDIEELDRCFSPRFSYYENDLEWLKEKVEADFFEPFGSLSVTLGRIEIEMVNNNSGYWMRQEAFDWLNGGRASAVFFQHRLITMQSDSGPVEVSFPPGAGAALPYPGSGGSYERIRVSGRPGGEVRHRESPREAEAKQKEEQRVSVRFWTDLQVEQSLGEVSFHLFLQARSTGSGGSSAYIYTLEERVIFLLEKEEGQWKIVSRQ